MNAQLVGVWKDEYANIHILSKTPQRVNLSRAHNIFNIIIPINLELQPSLPVNLESNCRKHLDVPLLFKNLTNSLF